MATLRGFLDVAGFDWKAGRIIYHPTDGSSPGWADLDGDPVELTPDAKVLDQEFYSGYGGPECPRFVAFDKDQAYFPYQYDGSTGVDTVYLDPTKYLGKDAKPTPYPGG